MVGLFVQCYQEANSGGLLIALDPGVLFDHHHGDDTTWLRALVRAD